MVAKSLRHVDLMEMLFIFALLPNSLFNRESKNRYQIFCKDFSHGNLDIPIKQVFLRNFRFQVALS